MGNRRFVRVNPTGAMILNGLLGGQATITAPSGPFAVGVNYTFSVVTSLTSPTFDWTNQAGVTVVSGQGTSSAVIRFDSAGIRSLVVDIYGSDGKRQRAAWIDNVGSTPPYAPALKFNDARNSQYLGIGIP